MLHRSSSGALGLGLALVLCAGGARAQERGAERGPITASDYDRVEVLGRNGPALASIGRVRVFTGGAADPALIRRARRLLGDRAAAFSRCHSVALAAQAGLAGRVVVSGHCARTSCDFRLEQSTTGSRVLDTCSVTAVQDALRTQPDLVRSQATVRIALEYGAPVPLCEAISCRPSPSPPPGGGGAAPVTSSGGYTIVRVVDRMNPPAPSAATAGVDIVGIALCDRARTSCIWADTVAHCGIQNPSQLDPAAASCAQATGTPTGADQLGTCDLASPDFVSLGGIGGSLSVQFEGGARQLVPGEIIRIVACDRHHSSTWPASEYDVVLDIVAEPVSRASRPIRGISGAAGIIELTVPMLPTP